MIVIPFYGADTPATFALQLEERSALLASGDPPIVADEGGRRMYPATHPWHPVPVRSDEGEP